MRSGYLVALALISYFGIGNWELGIEKLPGLEGGANIEAVYTSSRLYRYSTMVYSVDRQSILILIFRPYNI